MYRNCYLLLLASGIALSAVSVEARADIYKYVDADGNVTFTDRYRPGAVKAFSDFAPSRGHSAVKKKSSASNPSPASFPKVTSQTQRQRDDLRKQILVDERDHETRMLNEAQAALRARKPGIDAHLLNESIRQHQQNIGMLDKELSRFK
jgi:hypothetical protein